MPLWGKGLIALFIGLFVWGVLTERYDAGYHAGKAVVEDAAKDKQLVKDHQDASAVVAVQAVRDTAGKSAATDAAAEKIITKWRVRYVERKIAAGGAMCRLDDDWVRVHDAAALGADPGLLVPKRSGDASAPVDDAAVLDAVDTNYSTYRQVAREREQCRQELATVTGHRLASAAQ